MSKKVISPYYNACYARYDIPIEEIIDGLLESGYLGNENSDNKNDDNNSNTNTLNDSYRLEILTTNGNRITSSGFTTILYPRLYKNNIDITDDVPASCFKWTRVSGNSEKCRAEDAEFNLRFASGTKELPITAADVNRRALFRCNFVIQKDDEYVYINNAYEEYIKNNY